MKRHANGPYGRDSLVEGLGLTAQDVEVLAYYYGDGWSAREIGDLLGVHRQSVVDRIERCLRVLADHGLPTPQRATRPKKGKKINMGADLMDKLVNNQLSPLIIDRRGGR